ncbi:MAG: hypothetical protein Q9168_004028, partial [Polycauliona sp. 1 TL-2023]
MVDTPIALEVPSIVCYEPGEQTQAKTHPECLTDYWPSPDLAIMPHDDFEHSYTSGDLQYPVHSSMQRFLDAAGPYSADLPVIEQKQPQFTGKPQEADALQYYGSPNPWPHNIDTAHGPSPQESWSSEWPSLDQESCSGATGNTWSPQGTESCSEYDPRYSSWTGPRPVPNEYGYSCYSRELAQLSDTTSPQYTGALREIQAYPDQTESSPIKREPTSELIYPAIVTRLETGAAILNHDEALGSSINGSAITPPNTEDENVAVNDDSENGSDYAPQGRSRRAPRNKRHSINSRSQGSISPRARRLTSTRSRPHQLTQPAKITKRTSAAKTSLPNHALPPSQVRIPTHTVRCTYPHCSQTFPSASTLSKHILSLHTRPFTCSFARYGCKSTFGAKNEWKRHVASIHLSLGIYRCNVVGTACTPHPAPSSRSRTQNNHLTSSRQQQHHNPPQQQQAGCGYKSNRKDLFTQHLQRMHRPATNASRAEKESFDKSLDDVRRKCWEPIREAPPRSTCGFCAAMNLSPYNNTPVSASALEAHGPYDADQQHQLHQHHPDNKAPTKPAIFSGPESWDERMEHVGRHLEKGPV